MRKAVSLVLAGVMAFSLVGCSSSNTSDTTTTANEAGETTEASSGPVTLSVVTTYAGEDSNAQNFLDEVEAWKTETGNDVEDGSATSDENFKQKIATDFTAGTEPDVLFYFNGTDSNSFVEENKVVSIDEIREVYPDYASNMKDEMMGASPVDGKNYSVPVNGYWEGLFVNKAVLEEAGVDVPDATTTWSEFLDMCEKIKAAGKTPIAVSLTEVPHYWFEYSIYNHTSAETHNTVPTSVDDAAGQAWVAGLDDIKGLYDNGYLPENTLSAGDADTFQMFIDGDAAFLIDGSWKIGGIVEATDDIDNFTVTYVPGGVDQRKTTDIIGGISMGYYITRKAWDDPEKRDAAVSFVEHMTSDAVVTKFAGVSATALKNGVDTSSLELNSLQEAAAAMCSGSTGISPAVEDNLSDAQRKPIFQEMGAIVNGEKTSADAVQEVLDIIAKGEE